MSKSNTNRDRRETVERMRREAKAAERKRTLMVVALCGVVALIIVAAAGWQIYRNDQEKSALAALALADIGTDAQAAGCSGIEEVDGSGSGEHTAEPVGYEVQPPSFGPHNPTAAEAGIHMYSADDRPEVEMLVHNLEHGWTLVWYDETLAADDAQMKLLEGAAAKFDAEGSDFSANVILAPWTEADGTAIPEGKHIAFTHWSVHQPTFDPEFYRTASEAGTEIPSFGESQYCSSFSGGALDDFMTNYPYDDAPEGFLWHQ